MGQGAGKIASKLFFKAGQEKLAPASGDFFALSALDINGKTVNFSSFKGKEKAFMLVNVACNCGLTGNHYDEMVQLYSKYKDQGFTILGFPCNQFRAQEAGDNKEILDIVTNKYGVTFPMFSKINVNGPDTHPVYKFLRMNSELANSDEAKVIPWNFAKFLVDRNGRVVGYYPPTVKPFELEDKIKQLIQ